MSRVGRYIKEYSLAFIIFFLLISFTFLAFFATRKGAKERRETLFGLRTEQAMEEVDARIKDYVQILKGFKGLTYLTDTITREDWKKYVNILEVNENYPGIQGLGYTWYLTSGEEVSELENKIKSEGFPEYRILPSGERKAYTPIVYLEPFDWRNRRAFGFDMFSEPVRRQAMTRAIDLAKPVLTGKVILVQETQKNVQAGFLLYVPIYKNNQEPATVAERRKLIKGFVYSPFRADDLFSEILNNEYSDLDIEIYDGVNPGISSLLYSKKFNSEVKAGGSALTKTGIITAAGRKWLFVFTSNPELGAYSDRLQPYIILLSGLTISILFFFVFWSLTNTQRANSILQTVTSNATPGLFMVNNEGVCTYVNPAALNMMGYPFEEFKKDSIYNIVYKSKLTGNESSKSRKVIQKAIKNKVEFREEEDVLIRKNGLEFYAAIATKPVYKNGFVDSMVIEVRDITDEKLGAERIKSVNQALSKKNEELLKINRDLDNFIYTASHDLKAPVSNIEGLVLNLEELLVDKLDDEVKTVFRLINKSISRFKETIQDLTDITKVQKKIDQQIERVYVDEVLDEVKETIASLIEEANAEIRVQLFENEVNFSRGNFKSILYNILSNAIKYRHPERRAVVDIKVWKEQGGIGFSISDNGLGIDQNKVNKVFDMFKRLHSHVEGTGIGLYIVKRIVDNAGGRISVESTEGKGTVFTILLPDQK